MKGKPGTENRAAEKPSLPLLTAWTYPPVGLQNETVVTQFGGNTRKLSCGL